MTNGTAAGNIPSVIFTAQWTANTTTGGTTGGGGGGGTTSIAPAPAPAETTILPPEVPLAEPTATAAPVRPVAAARPAAPEAEAIVEEVEEPEVPLAGAEEPEEEEEPVLAEVEESEVPLASGDSWALLNLLLMILTVAGGVITTAGIMRKKEDEYEDEDGKNGRILRLISVVPAVVSAVVFFLTENLGSPMVFVDRMTVVMICITVVEAAVMLLVYREKALAKNTEK